MEKVNINLTFDSANEAAEFLSRASADTNVQKKALIASFVRYFAGEGQWVKIMLIKFARNELNMGLCEAKSFVESLASFKQDNT